ncbi:hypothetical protein, partial [Vibrio parahaemolyticus]
LGLNVGSAWFNIDEWELYKEYMGRVEMSEQKTTSNLVLELKPYLRSTYVLWLEGHCPKTILPKPTFY